MQLSTTHTPPPTHAWPQRPIAPLRFTSHHRAINYRHYRTGERRRATWNHRTLPVFCRASKTLSATGSQCTYVHLKRRRRKGALLEEKETVVLRTVVFSKKQKLLPLATGKEAVATCASPAKTKCCPSIVYIMQLLLPFEHPAQTGSQNNSHSRGIFAAHRGYQIWLTQQRSPHTTVFCYKLEGHKTPGTRSFFARY